MSEKVHYAPREVNEKERSLLAVLADNSDGLTLDCIAEKTGLPVSELSAMLLNMELSGLVRQIPGRRYVIC